ncbi:hypothetical protein WELLINGTON_212 [Erwinia phage Wellington]|jgi:hypothetical protein|uniref:Uncharacterized protein n=2 Tax=Wellingtonvirus wellington TaxID=2734153 RepID=A0A1B2IEC8_9CAUD|nr:hypothetical protein BIZ80_gp086 [Erwinia phage vB_EamM_Kwan]YP_009806696.1 hypothetical protein HOT70_gp089 [Erwinia phage Wellington]ANZ49565.1 hypothetical protein KWAN_213 [Erwinia phage vB_EamM_Kwan]AXF51338.1 hypothetical protein WELLINGTON_212 [Erwinia phage Wellington]
MLKFIVWCGKMVIYVGAASVATVFGAVLALTQGWF